MATIKPKRIPIVVGQRTARSWSPETGPRVRIPSSLRWKANGLDLLLVNIAEFDRKKFAALVEEFRKTAAGRQDVHLLTHLKALALNPRLRWPIELYSSLLRWATTPEYRQAALCAEAMCFFLFGSPLPRWYRRNQRSDFYKVNTGG